jgi:uncharacterized protein (TIGR02246 family)
MSARDNVEAAALRLAAAINAGNAHAAASYYTEDAVLLPPGHARIDGREQIEGYWKGLVDGGVHGVELRTSEVEDYTDRAVEIGVIIAYSGETELSGKYMAIWKHYYSGWKIYQDIWNWDA